MPARRGSAYKQKSHNILDHLPRPVTEEYLYKFNNLVLNEADNPDLANLVDQLIKQEKKAFSPHVIDMYRPSALRPVIKKLQPLVKKGNFQMRSHRPDVALKLYKQAMTGFTAHGMDRPLLLEKIAKAELAVAEAKKYARLKKSKAYLTPEDALAVSHGADPLKMTAVAGITKYVGGYDPKSIFLYQRGGAIYINPLIY